MTILLDRYQRVAKNYGVSNLPSLFVLDQEKAHEEAGGRDGDERRRPDITEPKGKPGRHP